MSFANPKFGQDIAGRAEVEVEIVVETSQFRATSGKKIEPTRSVTLTSAARTKKFYPNPCEFLDRPDWSTFLYLNYYSDNGRTIELGSGEVIRTLSVCDCLEGILRFLHSSSDSNPITATFMDKQQAMHFVNLCSPSAVGKTILQSITSVVLASEPQASWTIALLQAQLKPTGGFSGQEDQLASGQNSILLNSVRQTPEHHNRLAAEESISRPGVQPSSSGQANAGPSKTEVTVENPISIDELRLDDQTKARLKATLLYAKCEDEFYKIKFFKRRALCRLNTSESARMYIPEGYHDMQLFSREDLARWKNPEQKPTVESSLKPSIERPLKPSIKRPLKPSIERPLKPSIESPLKHSIENIKLQPSIQNIVEANTFWTVRNFGDKFNRTEPNETKMMKKKQQKQRRDEMIKQKMQLGSLIEIQTKK